MPATSNLQTDFRGGIWSPNAQGRMDDPRYTSALNESLNGYPREEGDWVRRSGFRAAAYTRNGLAAKIKPFSLSLAPSHTIEFTDEHIRLFEGNRIVTDGDRTDVVSVSSANPTVVVVADVNDWADNDQVVFSIESTTEDIDDVALLTGRVFRIDQQSTTSFKIYDSITGDGFDGSLVDLTGASLTVAKVTDLPTPYTNGSWETTNIVQADKSVLLLHASFPAQHIAIDNIDTAFPTFEISETKFIDGPYLDPHEGSTVTPSALTGLVDLVLSAQAYDATKVYEIGDLVLSTLTYISLTSGNLNNTPASSPTAWEAVSRAHYINGGLHNFAATDVGRHIRLYSAPPEWAAGTSYSTNNIVTFKGVQWSALKNMTGSVPATGSSNPNQPGLAIDTWVVNGDAARWTWGKITAINPSGSYDIRVKILGDPLLYSTPITKWRLGRYNATEPTWPTAGCYHEGRLYLASGNNHFDATQPGLERGFIMSPTEKDGTVTDGSGLSYTFDSQSKNKILWMKPGEQGILAGTVAGEWLISATNNNDIITPTSIQAHIRTAFGSSDIDPVVTDLTTVFVHRDGRSLHELFPDAYSGKIVAPTLQEFSKGLTKSGLRELAYQKALSPVIWACTNAGALVGTTYKRENLVSENPPSFNGWHRHTHGHPDRIFISVAGTRNIAGTGDALAVVTKDIGTGRYRVEISSDLMEVDDDIFAANFLDGFFSPNNGSFYGDEGTEIEIPDTPGYWEVPGYHLQAQCDPYTQENGLLEPDYSAVGFKLSNLGALLPPVVNEGPGGLIGAPILVTPPAKGGGAGCGIFSFTSTANVPGLAGFDLPFSNDYFTIFQWSQNSFGTNKWFPYQFWVQDDPLATPAQPIWHEPIAGGTEIINIGNPLGLSLSGLSSMDGTKVAVIIAGLDCGDFTVENGKVTVPYGSNPLYTHRYVQQVSALGRDWGINEVMIDGKYSVPVFIGYRYKSRGQRLRPASVEDTGAGTGTGFAKLRRNHRFGAMIHNSRDIMIGTDFDRLTRVQLREKNGEDITEAELFSGIINDTIDDDSSYDGMLCWEAPGPWPLNISAIGGNIQTQDQ